MPHEVSGFTVDEIMEAENEVVTGNDITVNWDTPVAEIMESIADIDEIINFGSIVEEPVITTTVISTHKVLNSVAKLKQFFVVFWWFHISHLKRWLLPQERVILLRQRIPQSKVIGYFQSQ